MSVLIFAAILECIKAELEAVVECIEKENIRESLSSKIKTAKGDEEENCEGVSVVSNYSEDQKCSRLSTKERNNSVITIQTLIGKKSYLLFLTGFTIHDTKYKFYHD